MIFGIVFSFISLWNIGLNDIWMKNEALYAESVREMIELKSYVIPYYNYEPRLHKPPLTYWSIIVSTKIFGLNEFAIRFPMFIFGILSILFTYKLARVYFSPSIAFYSVLALAFSPMFIGNIRYTAPEIPLLFFFTASLYFFLKGYKTNQKSYLTLFYTFLGLTVLTKGFPYYIIIGFIVFLYLIFQTKGSLENLSIEIKKLNLPKGIILTLTIGGWWYLYAFLDQGVWLIKEVFRETIHRATGYDEFLRELKPLYYIKVLPWAFLPFVWIAFLGIITAIKTNTKHFSFFLSWIGGMYIIFTLSAGKIPNYFLQAFPVLSIFAGYMITNYKNHQKIWRILFYTAILIPSIYIATYIVYGVIHLNISPLYLLFTLLLVILLLAIKKIIYIPVALITSFYLLLVIFVSPIVEKYRPYKEIGNLILQHVPDKTIPIFVEDKSLNNLIFYAQRKLYGKMSISQIKKHKIPYIAIIYEHNIKKFPKTEKIWCGYIYKNRGDSRILTLLKYVIKAQQGDMSGFDKMCVIYKKGEKNGGSYHP
ncbi:MAG: glycosyltransferase family 39 protein [Aquificae bacterium]|nr:glycosyltransferase family 39 protein [Aquificota bacterium]